MLALKRPNAASFDCCARSARTLVSSRKISTGPEPLADKGHEVRPDDRAAVRADDFTDSVAPVRRLLAPCLQHVRQARRHCSERSSARHVAAVQQLRGRFVDEADVVALVDDEDAFAQVLHDELVQLVEVREVDLALLGQRLAIPQSCCERDGEQRDGEQAGTGQSGDQEVRSRAVVLQERDRRFRSSAIVTSDVPSRA